MTYQIIKENLQNPKNRTVMIDSSSEVLEFENIEEAQVFCDILNANANDSKYYIKSIKSR
jgi:hypothetical protein